jgi:hypothetical protein
VTLSIQLGQRLEYLAAFGRDGLEGITSFKLQVLTLMHFSRALKLRLGLRDGRTMCTLWHATAEPWHLESWLSIRDREMCAQFGVALI